MEFATITPDRWDRPELLSFCKHQIDRMTVKPTKSYFITYQPAHFPDLIERVREGIKRAMNDGFEFVFILENDDFYPADYFEKMMPTESDCFIGDNKTTYYNLRNNTYRTFEHSHRSSLFNTGFNLNCIRFFDWPKNSTVFLDIDMWQFANDKGLKRRFVDSGSVGIKHGIGMVGGRGHKMTMKNADPNREHLKTIVDKEAFEFYQKLKVK